ncbi:1-hydroxycarotenoid 3,4-desaturase CrtD [Rhodopseudomonas pseudopalustris]|uniref:1-hydroxycarotenoid 3,4-desaturase n=1 Tax=Rhodopseudomonas pseudopalustris TaxID=1513892 RepID=A0A1H8R6I2_9BRAD|nr:1-hydroxycarotenoid 3,4-desaturase CrtD [Rhodopseudomonas pseudopalustris]SEO61946.1 1-hydroxycarotenoid 3,4-desaturase [Rhodopseudomonas pseudopalustris]
MRDQTGKNRVVVIGAGVAGLTSALALSARGLDVTVVERAAAPGGKIREVGIGASRIDSGPTVFTMRWVFEELFASAGLDFADHVRLRPLSVLARHAWDATTRLDLFADEARSTDAIGDFAGSAEAKRYRQFCADSRRIYQILERPFLRATAPSLFGLVTGNGLGGLIELRKIRPFTTMWNALGDYFHDPRLRQLFGRYSTYCGSSPFQAPATLMLVAHVEQQGVWIIEGGMHALARALADCATSLGATIRYEQEVREIMVSGGHAAGVILANGERIEAQSVIVNADVGALPGGLFGESVQRAVAPIAPKVRSLSAMTWSMVAKTDGFPLSRHTVFFSRDYAREFTDIFKRGEMPSEPTVYVCGQDRIDDEAMLDQGGEEELLVLVNAPPVGDRKSFDETEIARYAERTFGVLERCGLRIQQKPGKTEVTTPADFNRLFPATGGALYGRASHGWTASFERPGARTKIPGLYLAGGSTHPGPGVPMAGLSGRAAAASLIADIETELQGLKPLLRPVATSTEANNQT